MSINLILLFLAVEIIGGIFTFNFYKAAGRKAWEAFVPFYRIYVWLKIVERPWWWVILVYLPVVGNVMMVVLVFELLHVFNFRPLKHTIFSVITLGLYLGYLNFTAKLNYVGRDIKNMRKHVSELAASLIFAIVAATVIRAFTFEAFVIPTPSMEKSLLVGDFLFVSKLHYGSRPPMTPLSLPLVHNKIPLTTSFKDFGVDSYLDWPQLPYWRFPKIQDVERGDPVVFNYPAEDIRPINMEGKVRPIDKREHYVKRCLGIPGDTLKIIDRRVYLNGNEFRFPPRANPQWQYYVETNGKDFNPDLLKKRFDINYITGRDAIMSSDVLPIQTEPNQPISTYLVTISQDAVEDFKTLPNVKEVIPIDGRTNWKEDKAIPESLAKLYSTNQAYLGLRSGDLFPNPKNQQEVPFKWTRDNYGPLWIPKEGSSIELNLKNYYKYQRAITAYEGNTLEMRNGKFILNGKEATSYTFKQNYYWMMGDNRHASDDSRYWGFVPEDHIVGKPVFIWMSWDKYAKGLNKIRFDRVFTTVNGDSDRRSYFWPFIVAVVIIYLGSYYYKKRRRARKEAA